MWAASTDEMKVASMVASREETRAALSAATTVKSKAGHSVDAMAVHWVDMSVVARVASMDTLKVDQKADVMVHVKAVRLVYSLEH